MSSWTLEQIQEAELQREFDNGYSYAMWQIRTWQHEEEMWYEWAENNRFVLQDGQILDGKINP